MECRTIPKSANERVLACIRDYPRVKEGVMNGTSRFMKTDMLFCEIIEEAIEEMPEEVAEIVLSSVIYNEPYKGRHADIDEKIIRKTKKRFLKSTGVYLGIIDGRIM